MNVALLITQVITYSLAVWLGLYLLGRDAAKPPLRLTGSGLLAYAAALSLEALQPLADPQTARILLPLHSILIYLPALLWTGGLISLLPGQLPSKSRLFKLWQSLILPLSFVLVLIHTFFGGPDLLLALVIALPLFAAHLYLIVQRRRASDRFPLGLVLVATVFFGLAVGLFLPLVWLPRQWIVLSIGVDLVFLGFGIALFDAFEEGHRLRADILRAFQSAFFTALLFGGQIVLAIALGAGLSFPLVLLLFTALFTAIAIPTLATPLQSALDSLSPTPQAESQQERTGLRAAAQALSRLDPDVDFHTMPEPDFNRLTRRAISYLGDLPRLAASPLTRLPIITQRLAARNARDDTLERARELNALLTESIQRLKPAGGDRFGVTDAWRYYNALYFPYVVGLKPSRRYQSTQGMEPAHTAALDWFRTEVPERTLHNWQTAAARLVAQDLRERLHALNSV